MADLIKALQIFSKYTETSYPTHCEHDILLICNLDRELTEEDAKAVEELGFHMSEEWEGWCSFRYGSC